MDSIIHTNASRGTCFECLRKMPHLDVHHIFGGPNRSRSDEDGLTVYLCRECHNALHHSKDSGAMQYRYHRIGQEAYERTHTREEFMERYGRNYL